MDEKEWKKKLSKEEFRILRKKGTERAFSGKLWDNKKEGTYVCKACDLPLFSSDTKFKSGTGWPSFFSSIKNENVAEEVDRSYGVRTEVLCARCGGHLGHVFDDPSDSSGQVVRQDGKAVTRRYCINSCALDLKKQE